MELVDGTDLGKVLEDPLRFDLAPARTPKRAGPATRPAAVGGQAPPIARRSRHGIDPVTALTFTAEIADAVHAAHEASVLHRDLKPANVILRPTHVEPAEGVDVHHGPRALALEGWSLGHFGRLHRLSPLAPC